MQDQGCSEIIGAHVLPSVPMKLPISLSTVQVGDEKNLRHSPLTEQMFKVTLCLATVIAIVASQGFDYFGGFPSFAASPRDPRANRGPVTFPVTAIGRETSGVRVGASGYGFVPPGTRGGVGPHGAGPNFFSGLHYW